MQLSKRLREFRKQNGLTQKQIAEKLNIDRSTYSYYEIGKISPSINSLVILADFYGTTLDDFVRGNGMSELKAANPSVEIEEAAAKTEDEKKLLACYRKLSDLTKEEILVNIVSLARESDK